MSALTEDVPAAELRQDDFVTLRGRDGEEVLATISRVVAPQASNRVLVSYFDIVAGGPGTVDLGADDLVQRVVERRAS